MNRRFVLVAVVALLQAVLVAVAVGPRLSAHLRGEEYLLRVAPVDPIDPFRGAYVDLTYPDLQPRRRDGELPSGDVFVVLVEEDGFWVADGVVADRPDAAPYLACDSTGWGMSCGIESWFTDQDEAVRLEQVVAGGAVATVKIDSRGNAAIVDLAAG
jgi:uncharacterized membrane-anchored protein